MKIALLALISVAGISKAADSDYTAIQGIVGGVVASTAVKYAIEKAATTELVKAGSEAADVSPADLSKLGGLATGLVCFALVTSNADSKKSFNHLAKLVAPCALVLWATSTKTFREIAKRVPLIGEYFDCSNEECQGSCKDCRLTKGVLSVGTYLAVKDRI